MKTSKAETAKTKNKKQSHAWEGTWSRPMKISEKGLHPFTIARMTDHNVTGGDAPKKKRG